jgi:hypothetical protein
MLMTAEEKAPAWKRGDAPRPPVAVEKPVRGARLRFNDNGAARTVTVFPHGDLIGILIETHTSVDGVKARGNTTQNLFTRSEARAIVRLMSRVLNGGAE